MNVADVFFTSDDGLELYARDYPGPTAEAPVVLCLHGLTRNSKDFCQLAEHLSHRARVVVPDMRGRGRSARDPVGESYLLPRYARDVQGLLDALGVTSAHVIGTSMGGLIAMMVLSMAPDRVESIILNDIGPEIEGAGLTRIVGYVGHGMSVADWPSAAAQVKASNHAAFPDYTDADWLAMARDLFIQRDGHLWLDYDPAIAIGLANGDAAPQLWPLFLAASPKPLLVIRGEVSDLLSESTVARMHVAWPQVSSAVVPLRGHAPTLNEPIARSAIDVFLAERISTQQQGSKH
jgi:pimeloyl-ACP methyl ester carboxylesterase